MFQVLIVIQLNRSTLKQRGVTPGLCWVTDSYIKWMKLSTYEEQVPGRVFSHTEHSGLTDHTDAAENTWCYDVMTASSNCQQSSLKLAWTKTGLRAVKKWDLLVNPFLTVTHWFVFGMLLYRLWSTACQVWAKLELRPANKLENNMYNELCHFVQRKIHSQTTCYGLSMTSSSKLLTHCMLRSTDASLLMVYVLLGKVQPDCSSCWNHNHGAWSNGSDSEDIRTGTFRPLNTWSTTLKHTWKQSAIMSCTWM